MTKYILRLAKSLTALNVAELTSILQQEDIAVVDRIDWPLLNFFGHVIDIPDTISKSFDQILAMIPNGLRIYPINAFKIPDPKQVASGIGQNKKLVPMAQVNVTIDQTWGELNFKHIWDDPAFDGGVGILIGSCDTGVNQQHNSEYCFQDGPAGITPYPPHNRILGRKDEFPGETPYHPHGTWTTEIAARSPRQDGTFKGACYRAGIYDARVLNPEGQGSTLTVVDGLHWLAQQNVDVINVSLGGPHDDVLDAAIEELWNQGIICCCAAGNSGHWPPDCDGSINSPGDAQNAVCAGASSVNEQDDTHKNQWYIQSWTSRGKRVDGSQAPYYTVAPGLYLIPGYQDPANSGTSFSAPHHTGLVAALLHYEKRLYPNMSKPDRAKLVRDALENTAVSLGYDKSGNHTPEGAYCLQGHGRIAPDLAYDAVGQGGGPPPPPSGRKFNPVTGPTFTVTVHPLIPPPAAKEGAVLIAKTDKGEYSSGDTITVTALLSATSDLAPIAGRKVTVNFGIATQSGITDATGQAVITFIAPDVQQDTQVQGQPSFAGDA